MKLEHLVEVANVSEMENDDYAILRKSFLGASDSSVICGVNLFKNKDELLLEKNTKYITDADREIGRKPAVMKGRDLEPMILDKYIEETGFEVEKPKHMYHHPRFTYLSVNFDAVREEDYLIPVEFKLVTKYAERYYDKYKNETELPREIPGSTIKQHIEHMAKHLGFPAYYYTQVQQQILMCDTDEKACLHGDLYVWFDDSWTGKKYHVPRDDRTINHIITEGLKFSERIE